MSDASETKPSASQRLLAILTGFGIGVGSMPPVNLVASSYLKSIYGVDAYYTAGGPRQAIVVTGIISIALGYTCAAMVFDWLRRTDRRTLSASFAASAPTEPDPNRWAGPLVAVIVLSLLVIAGIALAIAE